MMPLLLARPFLAPALPHFAEADDPGVLQRLAEPALNLCIWRRKLNPSSSAAIAAILESPHPLELDLHTPTSEQLETHILKKLKKPVSSAAARGLPHLVADIVLLASLFRDLAEVRHFRVRMERVEDNGCALFHADSLRVRLLCTYAGPGTQWLENDNARRGELGSRGRTIDEANQEIVVDPSAIRSIPNWHVAVFKGRAWHDDEDISLIHRSSPVRHRGQYRIRLCIDQPNNCAC